MLAFIVTLMLSLGLSLTVTRIIEPLRNPLRVALALVANFVLVPILAYAIGTALGLDQPLKTGLIILALGAGAPFLPKLTMAAKGDVAYGVGLMFLLMVVTVFYMPLVLPILLPGVSVDPWSIAQSLVALMLIPLTIGLLAKAAWPDDAKSWQVFFGKVSTIFAVAVLVIGIGLDVPNVLASIGTRGLVAIIALVLGSMAIGLLLGGRVPAERSVMIIGTGFRNVAAAFVVVVTNFPGTPTVTFILVSVPVLIFLEVPTAIALGRRYEAA
jgi:BASS family bile acid:Na+ symporter